MARLQDVAEASELSVTTVSRYLNDQLTLPKETSDRIEAAIRRLNYRPNPHARSLSRGRTDTIGLVIPNIDNPFFARLAASVEEAASEHGLGVMLCASLNRPSRELDYIERLRRNHVDGLLFVTNHGDDGTLAAKINEASGVVLMDEDIAGTQAPKIFCDNEVGGRLAARHLIEAGHRRIAYIGGPKAMMSTAERLGGFRRVISEAGPGFCMTHELLGDYTTAHGKAATMEFLREPRGATAIFAASDEIMLGLLEVLRREGVRIPGDISLVAFDDVGPLALFDPPLTAIRQAVAAMGRRGVELVKASTSNEPLPAAVERLPVEIIVRSSVAAPPAKPRAHGRVQQRSM